MLMQRVFAVDVRERPRCGGKMKILATIHLPAATTQSSSRSAFRRVHPRSRHLLRAAASPWTLSESCSQRRPIPPADRFDYFVVIARPASYASRGGDGGKRSKKPAQRGDRGQAAKLMEKKLPDVEKTA